MDEIITKKEVLNKCDSWLNDFKESYDILCDKIKDYDNFHKVLLSFSKSDYHGKPTYSIDNVIQYESYDRNYYEVTGSFIEIPVEDDKIYSYLLANCLLYAINKSDREFTDDDIIRLNKTGNIYLDKDKRIEIKLDKTELYGIDKVTIIQNIVNMVLVCKVDLKEEAALNIVEGMIPPVTNINEIFEHYMKLTNEQTEYLKESVKTKGRI